MAGDVSALGGSFRVVAAGTDRLGPWVRYVGPEGGRLQDRRFLTGLGTPDSLTEYAGYMAVVDLEPREDARTAGALVGLDEPSGLDVPQDAEGRAPRWLTLGFDDEEALHATGLVPGDDPDDAWRLEAWSDPGGWKPLSGTPEVYAAPGTAPVADATYLGVVVAGRLAAAPPQPGTRPPLALWAGPDAYAPAKRWRRLPLPLVPDSISDLRCTVPACWIAGVRGGRVVLFDEVQRRARQVPTPAVDVPDDAAVLIASAPLPGGLVLAVETRRGNELWVRERPSAGKVREWRRLAAPEGQLEAARSSRGHAYMLVDGTLWHGELDELPPAR